MNKDYQFTIQIQLKLKQEERKRNVHCSKGEQYEENKGESIACSRITQGLSFTTEETKRDE